MSPQRQSQGRDPEAQDRRGPGVLVPPPLLFLINLALAYGLRLVYPVSVLPEIFSWAIGIILLAAGGAVLAQLIRAFLRKRVHLEPWKPTASLITDGYYAYSRNPIYVALCIVSTGIGFLFNSLWMILAFIPSLVMVDLLVIRREEAYLEAKFGETYLSYKRKVRRWL